MVRFVLVIGLWLSTFSGVAAQSAVMPSDVLVRAQRLAAEARATYPAETYSIDQSLWREAIEVAERGLERAPDDLGLLRFMAETHTSIDWYIRAWDYWLRYFGAGGSFDTSAQTQVADVGAQLGYARYQAGNLGAAIDYYQLLYTVNPSDTEALRWLGRIYFERGEPRAALPYWREAAARNAEGAEYYLRRTEQQLAVGVNASDAFHQGLGAYNAGELDAALNSFRRATAYNDTFAEAFAWTGRVTLELGRPAAAVSAWEQVVALTPDDDGARYFLEVARAQQTWGVLAARAFYDGLSLYNGGRIAEASAQFAEAAQHNPAYTEAFVWAARSYQELGEGDRAAAYWQRVLDLDPNDERARYFLDRTGGGSSVDPGVDPGVDLAVERGVSAYQQADFGAAEEAFTAAVTRDAKNAEAWGWLGRIYFERGDYAQAADAYGRAEGLEPTNDAYQFFAAEATRLAGSAD